MAFYAFEWKIQAHGLLFGLLKNIWKILTDAKGLQKKLHKVFLNFFLNFILNKIKNSELSKKKIIEEFLLIWKKYIKASDNSF